MPEEFEEEAATQSNRHSISVFPMKVTLFGPLRPARELHRRTQRVIKARGESGEHFTEITLTDDRLAKGMVVEYQVRAKSPRSAKRVGMVYLSQLCDLLSAMTQCPVIFFADAEDAREERGRLFRQTMHVNRILTPNEWEWVTGALAALRHDHPRFLAAASWYRKGLIGNDCLDGFCCFWRVIERLAESYADRSAWEPDDKGVRKSVAQLTSDLFEHESAPKLLQDAERVRQVVQLRNDISHGNKPITVDMIDAASDELEFMEEAAFAVLTRVRQQKLTAEY